MDFLLSASTCGFILELINFQENGDFRSKNCGGKSEYSKSFQKKGNAPGEIRTPDLLIRSQTLYPAELRAHAILS